MDESEEDEQERKKRLKREADRRSTQLSRQRKKAFDEDHDYSEEEEDDDDDTPVVRRKKKKVTTAFLRKLLDLIEDTDVPEIAWDEDGTGVSLQRGPALDRVLGDRFAAKNEWASFLRQLNLYNFTRSSREGNTVVYENAAFTRTSTPAQIARIQHRAPSATATSQATGAPAVEAPLPEEDDPDWALARDPAAFRKRKRDATGHFAARKKAGGRVPKQAVPNEREWAEFRAKRGAPLHDLLDLFADSGDEEE